MQTAFARYLVVILLSATGASAQEGKIIQLKQPIIGCENKADLRDFPYELPKAISLSEMPLPYREGRCVKLAPGPPDNHKGAGNLHLSASRAAFMPVGSQ
jgi:hypothetical protein